MKKVFVICSSLLLLNTSLSAQDKTTNYRRSSLTMVLLENEGLGKSKDLVIGAYNSHPFPDKYNLHSIEDKKFSTTQLGLTTQDYVDAGFYKDTLKKITDFLKAKKKYPLNKIRNLNPEGTIGIIEPTSEELNNIYINKYIKEKKIAKQVVSTWFNRKQDGSMNWELIKERGLYSASSNDKDIASTSASAVDYLLDFELIGNTYTVFNRMDFYENEPVARLIRDAAIIQVTKELAGKPEILLKKSLEGLEKVYQKTKEGYTVLCYTYLYQLEWNDSIASKTKHYFFNTDASFDKIKIWDTTNLYKMKFVGRTSSSSIVTFKLGEQRTEAQIIDLQVKRTMDNALAKLQKEYVQFRPVAPITSIEPVTAKIGLKEGLEPGQKFEILEQSFNKLNMPVWKSIGKVSVNKKTPIWDNTVGAEQKIVQDQNQNQVPKPEYSTFTGGKKAMVGLHYIRLIK